MNQINPNSLVGTRAELAALREEFDSFRQTVMQSFMEIIEKQNRRIEALEAATYGKEK
jgi:hypothetical protein